MFRMLAVGKLSAGVRAVDPRRSVMSATVWLVIALAVTFTVGASIWVGGLAREIVLQQHVRRLALETDQIGADVNQAIATRLGALRVAEAMLAGPVPLGARRGLRDVFEELVAAYPDLDWLAIAGADGIVAAARPGIPVGTDVRGAAWFAGGRDGPWIGAVGAPEMDAPVLAGPAPALGVLAAPLRDASGSAVGVILARLSWRSSPNHLRRLSEVVGRPGAAQAVLLSASGLVLVGPQAWRSRPWPGVPDEAHAEAQTIAAAAGDDAWAQTPRFERLPNQQVVLVARAPITARGDPRRADYEVQLGEPRERVYERADGLARQILWVSVFLGAVTAIAGALGASRLTRRLRRLTESVMLAGRSPGASLEIPSGRDEVAQLGSAFGKLLGDLQAERTELRTLSEDLERRVAERTREVERLAEEARYAAVVRERLKIARELHDTLAHSLMALLSQIRLLRRLQRHDPAAVSIELERAEQVAHEGLAEARTAIAQMRVNRVRDTGLGTALLKALTAFGNDTGIAVDYRSESAAAAVADERAEAAFNMAGEILRNVKLHARATSVSVTLLDTRGGGWQLTVADDGVGFDVDSEFPGHFGLVGLREQAQLVGAELVIESVPNHGTKVVVSWPGSPAEPGRP
jgi:signal transduction histidine kinase